MRIALVGNPNCGKTTLFNALTGSNQYVGNWPGVTVEKKEGKIKKHPDYNLIDLPGIYSLSPYTLEEVVARNVLLEEDIDLIVNIVDASNMERNLYLTSQLLELDIPLVVALNMMDVVNKRHDKVDVKVLERDLGCPVVEISALKEVGLKSLVEVLDKVKNTDSIFSFTDDIEQAIQTIINQEKCSRLVAIKILEQDEKIESASKYSFITKSMEDKYEDDIESIITNQRYGNISATMNRVYTYNNESSLTLSDKIDKIVTNRFLGLPIFALVMFVVYYISVSTIGQFATDWVNDVLFPEIISTNVVGFLETIRVNKWLISLINDGIIAGVGAVLGFIPQLVVLYIMLAFLEGCGYMSRVAFVMDRIFKKFHLSGKSFIPMLIGTGCSVPAIMATRTIENLDDRRMTIMTTSFIPCSAKLPIIALIAGALFNNSGLIATSAYFIGILAIIISGIILKKTKMFSNDSSSFVMELPSYHLPTFKTIYRSTLERASSFIKKAGTIILLSSIIIWALTNIGIENGSIGFVGNMDNSFLAMLGSAVSWIFIPLGFGTWQAGVASIMGLVAKENVVSTLGIVYGFGEVSENGMEFWQIFAQNFTSYAAYSFLVFNLLCAPCFAAIGAIKREMNDRKWFIFALSYQTIFAYLLSFIIYQFALAIDLQIITFSTIMAMVVFGGFIYLLISKDPFKKHIKDLK